MHIANHREQGLMQNYTAHLKKKKSLTFAEAIIIDIPPFIHSL